MIVVELYYYRIMDVSVCNFAIFVIFFLIFPGCVLQAKTSTQNNQSYYEKNDTQKSDMVHLETLIRVYDANDSTSRGNVSSKSAKLDEHHGGLEVVSPPNLATGATQRTTSAEQTFLFPDQFVEPSTTKQVLEVDKSTFQPVIYETEISETTTFEGTSGMLSTTTDLNFANNRSMNNTTIVYETTESIEEIASGSSPYSNATLLPSTITTKKADLQTNDKVMNGSTIFTINFTVTENIQAVKVETEPLEILGGIFEFNETDPGIIIGGIEEVDLEVAETTNINVTVVEGTDDSHYRPANATEFCLWNGNLFCDVNLDLRCYGDGTLNCIFEEVNGTTTVMNSTIGNEPCEMSGNIRCNMLPMKNQCTGMSQMNCFPHSTDDKWQEWEIYVLALVSVIVLMTLSATAFISIKRWKESRIHPQVNTIEVQS